MPEDQDFNDMKRMAEYFLKDMEPLMQKAKRKKEHQPVKAKRRGCLTKPPPCKAGLYVLKEFSSIDGRDVCEGFFPLKVHWC